MIATPPCEVGPCGAVYGPHGLADCSTGVQNSAYRLAFPLSTYPLVGGSINRIVARVQSLGRCGFSLLFRFVNMVSITHQGHRLFKQLTRTTGSRFLSDAWMYPVVTNRDPVACGRVPLFGLPLISTETDLLLCRVHRPPPHRPGASSARRPSARPQALQAPHASRPRWRGHLARLPQPCGDRSPP